MRISRTYRKAHELSQQAPAGWKATVGEGWHDGESTFTRAQVPYAGAWVAFERTEGGDLEVCVALNVVMADKWSRKRALPVRGAAGLVVVDGHTCYNHRSFTRHGIDTCSVELVPAKVADDKDGGHAYADLAALLAGELERCRKAHVRSRTAVAVPGLPYLRQPEWFKEAAAQLRAGTSVTLTPGGMGTAHRLTRTRRRGLQERACDALEKALGVSPVFVETLDWD